jgi:hypothetical protein
MFRHVRINFNRNMQQNSLRESYRRSINYLIKGDGKDRIVHRCVKRSIKHFENMAIRKILYTL